MGRVNREKKGGYLKKELKDILNYNKEGYKMVNSCTDYRRGYEDAKKTLYRAY